MGEWWYWYDRVKCHVLLAHRIQAWRRRTKDRSKKAKLNGKGKKKVWNEEQDTIESSEIASQSKPGGEVRKGYLETSNIFKMMKARYHAGAARQFYAICAQMQYKAW